MRGAAVSQTRHVDAALSCLVWYAQDVTLNWQSNVNEKLMYKVSEVVVCVRVCVCRPYEQIELTGRGREKGEREREGVSCLGKKDVEVKVGCWDRLL